MKLQERIEQIAREAVSTHHPLVQTTEQMVERALIAILTDPAVGFKEALERGVALSKAGAGLFHEIDELMGDTDPIDDDDATLACQSWWKALHGFESVTAESKLKELAELEERE